MELDINAPIDHEKTRPITAREHAINGLRKEKHCLKLLDKYLEEDNLFIDIGAHAGYYSLYAREIVGPSGQVYAFEPNHVTFPILTSNLTQHYKDMVAVGINSMVSSKWHSVHLYDVAVTNHNDGQIFRSDFYAEASKLLPKGVESRSKNEYPIKTMKLDVFFEKANFIKIDAEGEELRVLEGATSVLSNSHPHLLIEIHYDQDVDVKDIIRLLKDHDYICRDAKRLKKIVTNGNIYERTKHIFATIAPKE